MCFHRVNRACFLFYSRLAKGITSQTATPQRTPQDLESPQQHLSLSKESQTSDMAALESLLEGLRENSFSTLRLPLDEDSDMPLLLGALLSNASVEEVNVDIYECFRNRDQSSREVLDLFQALSKLPKLQRLWVDSGREGSPFYTLNVQCLAVVLEQAPSLERLGMFDVELAGTLEDLAHLESALKNHASLKNFGLVGCRLAQATVDESMAETATIIESVAIAAAGKEGRSDGTIDFSDPITKTSICCYAPNTCYALNRLVQECLANCAWVELQGQEHDALGELSGQALGSLCESHKLTRLTLDHFDLKDEHIVAMSQALETSTTIRELKITCELGRLGCIALSQLLFVNTSLTNLTLQMDELIMDDVSLENINDDNRIDALKSQDRDPSLLIAQALETNQCLQYFCLSGYAKITKKSQEAFATLLRQNMTLLNCELDLQNCGQLSDDLQQEVNMFLNLNELGRKELLQGINGNSNNDHDHQHQESSPQKWVHVLWEVRHDLSALYYLLSLNPMLCDQSGPRIVEGRESVPTYSGLSHLQYKYLLS